MNESNILYSQNVKNNASSMLNIISVNNSKVVACCLFIVAATIYHIWPNTITGILVILVTVRSMLKYPAILVFVVAYGYITHTIIRPDSTRIYFSILILCSFYNFKQLLQLGHARIDLRRVATILCILSFVIIISEIADPVTTSYISSFIGRLGNIFICLFIIVSIKSEFDRWLSILALSFSSILLSIYFIWFTFSHGIGSLYSFHAEGNNILDPNYLAFHLSIGLAPLLILSIHPRAVSSFKVRVITIASVIVVLWGILLTASRTGSVLIGLAIIISAFGCFRSKLISILFLFSLIFGALFLIYPFMENTQSFSFLEARWGADSVSTGTGRTKILIESIDAFNNFNLIQILVGGGSEANYVLLNGKNTHNSYMEFLLDHGLIGLILLLALLFFAAKNILFFSFSPITSAMLVLWAILFVSSFSLSPFVRSWAWIALAPLLVPPFESSLARSQN